MSRLRKDPIREVPKRVLLLSCVITILIVVATFFFEWMTLMAVVGFWMGVGINLINFRIIVIGANSYLEKSEAGKKASMKPNIMLRFLLYGVVFLVAWRLGTPALMGSLLGACMVNFALKSDGFFTMGLNEKKDSNLRQRASIDRTFESEEGLEATKSHKSDTRDEASNKEEIPKTERNDQTEETIDKELETLDEEELEKIIDRELETLDEEERIDKELETSEEEEIEIYL